MPESVKMTKALQKALDWLAAHNGEGHFGGAGNTLMAAGEIAPFMRSTWNRLEVLGKVKFSHGRKRIQLVRPE
jgi:hypothetical protein